MMDSLFFVTVGTRWECEDVAVEKEGIWVIRVWPILGRLRIRITLPRLEIFEEIFEELNFL